MSSSRSACIVCAGPNNDGTCHFGVRCCRACASFFQRSCKEKRTYVCRWHHNCQITNDGGLRNSCRACRLRKCLQVGMALEKKRDRKATSVRHHKLCGENVPVHPDPLCSVLFPICPPPFSAFPLTSLFAESIHQFRRGLRALSVVEGISSEFAIDLKQVRVITHTEFIRTEKGTALLAYEMLCRHLPSVASLPAPSRLNLLKLFTSHFGFLMKAEMTIELYGESDTPYVVMVPGGVADIDNLEQMFTEIADMAQRDKLRNATYYRCLNFGRLRYRPLRVTPLELAALTGIVLWNAAERVDALPIAHINAQKEALFAELYNLCAQSTPNGDEGAQTAIRFAKLLDMLRLLALNTTEIEEACSMGKIFMNMADVWDDIAPVIGTDKSTGLLSL